MVESNLTNPRMIDQDSTLAEATGSIVDLLAMPDVDDIEFEAPRADGLYLPADFD